MLIESLKLDNPVFVRQMFRDYLRPGQYALGFQDMMRILSDMKIIAHTDQPWYLQQKEVSR